MSMVDTSGWKFSSLLDVRRVLLAGGCPVCGRPFVSPLNHAARKHGISGRDMRRAAAFPLTQKLTEPALSARYARNGYAHRANLSRSGRP